MKIESILKNIEKQNKLRRELHIKELALVGSFTYHEKKAYKSYKSFLKDLEDEYISSFVEEVLNMDYNLDEPFLDINDHTFIHTFYIKEVE